VSLQKSSSVFTVMVIHNIKITMSKRINTVRKRMKTRRLSEYSRRLSIEFKGRYVNEPFDERNNS